MRKRIARLIVRLFGIRRVLAMAGTEPKLDLAMRVRRFDDKTGTYGDWEDRGTIASNHRSVAGNAAAMEA